jgi:peroxin-10
MAVEEGQEPRRGERREEARRMRGFPGAAQPEVMRAAEKDEHYVAHLCEACHESFRHVVGTRLAVAYQNETRLAGRVLYYLLTTGSGLQTLGEEYCDISQVDILVFQIFIREAIFLVGLLVWIWGPKYSL